MVAQRGPGNFLSKGRYPFLIKRLLQAYRVGQLQIYDNAFIPQCLVELNRQAPLGYQLQNPMPERLPENEFLHSTKADLQALQSLQDILNTEPAAAPRAAGPIFYQP